MDLNIDAPFVSDFAHLDEDLDPEAYDDWFFRSDSDESYTDPSPSPKKKQKTVHDNGTQKPRRSPRLVTAAKKPLRVPVSNKKKTTEELELEEIARRREEWSKNKKMHEMTYKKAIAINNTVSAKSAQPPTVPQEFHFHSDQRLKGTEDAAADTSVKDFAKTLRSSQQPSGPNQGSRARMTRPKPFNLTTSKSTSALSADKFKSTAEQVESYKDRFRSDSHKGSTTTKRADQMELTVAKTPNFSTKGRGRTRKLPTREEEEEMEFEEHKKQQFKAHPVNHKILREPQRGLPKVKAKEPTAIKEFNLHSTSNIHKPQVVEEEQADFHARPVNKKILEGPTGIKPAEKRNLTVPESPAFALRGRLRPRVQQEEPTAAPIAPSRGLVKSVSVPHHGVPFKPQLQHKHTVSKPFAVEEHSKQMLKRKNEKIKQVLEQERKAHEFHATALPSDSPDQLPPKQIRPLTAAEPFQLKVDQRGNKYKKEWIAKIEEEQEQAKAKSEFHATTNKVVFKTPFVPEKSTKPLTEMSSFTLNTDSRSVKREEFNQHLKANEAEFEAIKRQREERQVIEDKEAVHQLRQQMVHKATDIKKYKPVSVQHCDKPLTEAKSPFLLTKNLRSRLTE